MDASARVTMKDAAKCDKRRERQNSENQQNAERILHFQVTPGSMSGSGRQRSNAAQSRNSFAVVLCVASMSVRVEVSGPTDG